MSESFLQSIKRFVREAKTEPDHIVNQVKQALPPQDRASLDQQLKTFEQDAIRLSKGELTYSEMRSLYG
jgi:hypothetical protein